MTLPMLIPLLILGAGAPRPSDCVSEFDGATSSAEVFPAGVLGDPHWGDLFRGAEWTEVLAWTELGSTIIKATHVEGGANAISPRLFLPPPLDGTLRVERTGGRFCTEVTAEVRKDGTLGFLQLEGGWRVEQRIRRSGTLILDVKRSTRMIRAEGPRVVAEVDEDQTVEAFLGTPGDDIDLLSAFREHLATMRVDAESALAAGTSSPEWTALFRELLIDEVASDASSILPERRLRLAKLVEIFTLQGGVPGDGEATLVIEPGAAEVWIYGRRVYSGGKPAEVRVRAGEAGIWIVREDRYATAGITVRYVADEWLKIAPGERVRVTAHGAHRIAQ